MTAATHHLAPGSIAPLSPSRRDDNPMDVAVEFLAWARGQGWTNADVMAAIGESAPVGVEPETSAVAGALVLHVMALHWFRRFRGAS